MTSGRHFLQIPGPTNVPERVLRAMDRPVPDHRGPEMPSLVGEIRTGLRSIFKSERGEPVIFSARRFAIRPSWVLKQSVIWIRGTWFLMPW